MLQTVEIIMQTLSTGTSKRLTLTEYRRLEESAVERHEYHDGVIVTMTGGTLEHSAISGNIYAQLKHALKKTQFKPFNSDLRIWVPQYQRGIYPDVMVIEGVPKFNDQRRDEIINPKLVVEVLSRSTEAYDRGDKFMYYRSIPEFSEYLLVNQYQPRVDHYIKSTVQEWLMRSYAGLEETVIDLKIVGVQLSMADIYEEIDFASEG